MRPHTTQGGGRRLVASYHVGEWSCPPRGGGRADFLRAFRENVDAFCAFDARLCRGGYVDGFDRRFLRLLLGERFHLRPEAVFDELRIGGRQQVLVG